MMLGEIPENVRQLITVENNVNIGLISSVHHFILINSKIQNLP